MGDLNDEHLGPKDLWTLWPVLHFEADFAGKFYDCFGLGAYLIRAEPDVVDEFFEIVSSSLNPYSYSIRDCFHWALAIRLPHAPGHVPSAKPGEPFPDLERRVQTWLVNTFLTCLRLIKPTKAICPTKFSAVIDSGSIVKGTVKEDDDYQVCDLFLPAGSRSEPFTDADLLQLVEIWDAMVRLRKLDCLLKAALDGSLFARLDQDATAEAQRHTKFLLDQLPEELREKMTFSQELDASRHLHSPIFDSLVSKEEKERFLDRTRVGRALALFDGGLGLPRLHAFLSMCLVLETLFTIGRGEVTHKLAVRLAKICAKEADAEATREYYQRAKNVYNERSDVVHGEKTILAVDPSVERDAFALARLSLQRILLDEKLVALYSAPGTSDEVKRKKERELRDYFLELELR